MRVLKKVLVLVVEIIAIMFWVVVGFSIGFLIAALVTSRLPENDPMRPYVTLASLVIGFVPALIGGVLTIGLVRPFYESSEGSDESPAGSVSVARQSALPESIMQGGGQVGWAALPALPAEELDDRPTRWTIASPLYWIALIGFVVATFASFVVASSILFNHSPSADSDPALYVLLVFLAGGTTTAARSYRTNRPLAAGLASGVVVVIGIIVLVVFAAFFA